MGGISFFRSPYGHLQRGRLLDGGPAAAAAVAAASPATAGASTVAALGVPRPAGVDSCSGPGLFLVLGVVVARGLDVGAPGLAQSQFGVLHGFFGVGDRLLLSVDFLLPVVYGPLCLGLCPYGFPDRDLLFHRRIY